MPKALSAPDDCGSGLQPLKLSTEPVMFGHKPNIQGELRNHNSDFTQPTGVFSIGSIQATGQGTDQGSTGSWVTYFYASRASSIYGGDNVQSPAIQVLPCIRT